jgi:hypothetical protein
MDIQVTCTSAKTAAAIKDAAIFLLKEVLGPRMAEGVTLDIDVVKKLDVEGECVNEDETKRSRWFTITLKDAPFNKLLETLAHELVHVKQYVRNELGIKSLVLTKGGRMKFTTKWMGEVWVPKGNEDDYFDTPWEIEAFGREQGLANRYINYRKQKGL